MRKKCIALILCLSMLLMSLTACNRGGTDVENTTPELVDSPTETTTPVTEATTTMEKEIWTGAEFDNPAAQAKFETLLSRIVTNLESNGIVVIGADLDGVDVDDDSLSPWDKVGVAIDTAPTAELNEAYFKKINSNAEFVSFCLSAVELLPEEFKNSEAYGEVIAFIGLRLFNLKRGRTEAKDLKLDEKYMAYLNEEVVLELLRNESISAVLGEHDTTAEDITPVYTLTKDKLYSLLNKKEYLWDMANAIVEGVDVGSESGSDEESEDSLRTGLISNVYKAVSTQVKDKIAESEIEFEFNEYTDEELDGMSLREVWNAVFDTVRTNVQVEMLIVKTNVKAYVAELDEAGEVIDENDAQLVEAKSTYKELSFALDEINTKSTQVNRLYDLVDNMMLALKYYSPSLIYGESGRNYGTFIIEAAGVLSELDTIQTSRDAWAKILDMGLVSKMLKLGFSASHVGWGTSCADAMGKAETVEDYVGIINNYAYLDEVETPDLGDWRIAPELSASSFKTGFNEKASEWGVPDVQINKVYMSEMGIKFPKSVSIGSSTSNLEVVGDYYIMPFRSNAEDYIVLAQLFSYMWACGDMGLSEAAAYLSSNFSKMFNKAQELYDEIYALSGINQINDSELRTDEVLDILGEIELENGVGDDCLRVELDDQGQSELINRFLSWLKDDMPSAAYKELCSMIDLDTLDYESLITVLSRTDGNLGNYGISATKGLPAMIQCGTVVGDWDWYLKYPLTSGMLTETDLRDTVLNYVIYVGTITGENYMRSLDIALSGMINKFTENNHMFCITYNEGSADIVIAKG